MIASIFFIFFRLLQLLTLIPAMGMLVRQTSSPDAGEQLDHITNDLAGLFRQPVQ